MKHSLRKTPAPIHLAYRYRAGSGRLVGRNFTLIEAGRELTLAIDLGAAFQTRDKTAQIHQDALHLAVNHRRLATLQCPDNLLRSRLIRAWERVAQPELRLCLDLGPRGRCLYSVLPRSLLVGGVELDVQAVLEEDSRVSQSLPPQTMDYLRNPA